jgi:hypothetical protein
MKITGARLALPRVFDGGVEIAPETAPNVHLAAVNFDLGSAVVKRNQFEASTEIAVGLMLAGKENTFACLFLDVPSAKALAQKLLEVTA